jgi:hypothetical protein
MKEDGDDNGRRREGWRHGGRFIYNEIAGEDRSHRSRANLAAGLFVGVQFNGVESFKNSEKGTGE